MECSRNVLKKDVQRTYSEKWFGAKQDIPSINLKLNTGGK